MVVTEYLQNENTRTEDIELILSRKLIFSRVYKTKIFCTLKIVERYVIILYHLPPLKAGDNRCDLKKLFLNHETKFDYFQKVLIG